MIYVDILILATIVVFVVDVSGFPDTIKRWLSRWLGKNVSSLKPFDCSLCMVWWAGVALLIIQKEFTLNAVAFVSLMAALAYPVSQIISLLQSLIVKLCNVLSDLLKL